MKTFKEMKWILPVLLFGFLNSNNLQGQNGPYHCLIFNNDCISCSNLAGLDYTICTTRDLRARRCDVQGELGYSYEMQWQKRSENQIPVTWYDLTGETNIVYNVSEPGHYRCYLKEYFWGEYQGDYYTGIVNIQVAGSKPSITGGTIGDKTYCHGDNDNFTVTASGSYINYQWQVSTDDGASWDNISEATSSTYNYTADVSHDGNIYKCSVFNACGTATAQREINVTVETAPSITTQPSDAEACPEDQKAFSVVASGTSPSYQWYHDDVIISGATSSTYTDFNVLPSDAGNYTCVVSNNCDSVTSSIATLTVNDPLALSAGPSDETVCDGDNASFSVSAIGTAPITYQWQISGDGGSTWSDMTGKTSSTLNFTADLDDHNHAIRCKLGNICTSALYTQPVKVYVNPLPSVSLGPDVHVCTGESTVLDPGGGYSSYSWNTGPSTRTIQVSEAGTYTVTVTDANNCENSDDIQVFLDPNITPVDLGDDIHICLGESADLDPGADYDQYTWSTDATTQSINATETGTYTVTVKNNNSVCEVSDKVHVNVHDPYNDQELGVVTVDIESGDNLVIWERTPDAGIEYYKIYRGNTLLDSVYKDEPSEYQDVGTFDDGISYRYKLTIIDTCNNESDYSTSHKTMHLTASVGTAGEVNLEWNHYEGFDVDWYYIFRSNSFDKNFEVYDSIEYDITTTAKTDYDPIPPPDTSYYRIGVKTPRTFFTDLKKAGSGPYSYSLSNIEDNRASATYIQSHGVQTLQIYPNPMQKSCLIRFDNPGGTAHKLHLRDMSGRTVRVADNIRSKEYRLKRGELAAGLYFIEIRGDKVFRGRVVIE